MAQMRAAIATHNFCAPHEQRIIRALGNRVGRDRLKKARPARAAVIFRVGNKQRLIATNTMIGAGRFRVPIRPGKRTLGSRLAGYIILFRG